MLSHSVRRNLPKLLAAPQSGLLLRLGPGGSGGLPERTARLSTRHELRDLPCPTRGGYLLATLVPMRFPIAALGRWRALSRCDGWRFQTDTRWLAGSVSMYSPCHEEGLERPTSATKPPRRAGLSAAWVRPSLPLSQLDRGCVMTCGRS